MSRRTRAFGAAPRGEISSEAFDIVLLVAYDFAMPTVLRIGPYRFFFYASDRDEPMHIHVERYSGCQALAGAGEIAAQYRLQSIRTGRH